MPPFNFLPDKLSSNSKKAAIQLDSFRKSTVGVELAESLNKFDASLAETKIKFQLDESATASFKTVLDVVALHPAAAKSPKIQNFLPFFKADSPSGIDKKLDQLRALSWVTFVRCLNSLRVAGSDNEKIAGAVIAASFSPGLIPDHMRQLIGGDYPFGQGDLKIPDLGQDFLNKIIRSGIMYKFLLCEAKAGAAYQEAKAWADSAQTDLTNTIMKIDPKEGCANSTITITCHGQILQSDLTYVMFPLASGGYTGVNLNDINSLLYDRNTDQSSIGVKVPEGIGSGCIGFVTTLPPLNSGPVEDCGGELSTILGPLASLGIVSKIFEPQLPSPPCLATDSTGLPLNYFAGGPPEIIDFSISNGGMVHSGDSVQLSLKVRNAKHVSISPVYQSNIANGAFLPAVMFNPVPGTDGVVQINSIVIPNNGVSNIYHDWDAEYKAEVTNDCNTDAPVTSSIIIRMREVRPYLIGLGKAEVTDYAIGLPMQGMSMPFQRSSDVESPLWARSFVIVDKTNHAYTALVVVDIWSCSIAIKREVLKRLAGIFPNIYNDANVWVAGTHSHSGPAGFLEHFLYNASGGGFDEHNFTNIVEGIVASIKKAHENFEPGRIFINSGIVPDCGRNRSIEAYLRNPLIERDQYQAEGATFEERTINATDKEMLVLKFRKQIKSTGLDTDLGMLCWYAIHPTNRSQNNTHICGDNKGWAAMLFEDSQSAGNKNFVAAFANSNAGDVSGNVEFNSSLNNYKYDDGTNHEVDDKAHMIDQGERQFNAATQIYNIATEEVTGPIEVRHQYIDMVNRTGLPAALGLSMFGGSSEDSTGCPGIVEGITDDLSIIDPTVLQHLPVARMLAPRILDLTNAAFQLNYIANGYAGDDAVKAIPVIIAGTIFSELSILLTAGPVAAILAAAPTIITAIDVSQILANSGLVGVPTIPNAADSSGHAPKPIAVTLGRAATNGALYPIVPTVIPVQLIRIGQFCLTGLPAEITTMAGRRLRERVQGELAAINIAHVAIGSYANGYCGYITTPEEYDAQHYEGASTLYGRTTLDVFTTVFSNLTTSLLNGSSVQDDARPFDFSTNPVHVLRNPRITVRNLSADNIRLRFYDPGTTDYFSTILPPFPGDIILEAGREHAFIIPPHLLLQNSLQILSGDTNSQSVTASADPAQHTSMVTIYENGTMGTGDYTVRNK